MRYWYVLKWIFFSTSQQNLLFLNVKTLFKGFQSTWRCTPPPPPKNDTAHVHNHPTLTEPWYVPIYHQNNITHCKKMYTRNYTCGKISLDCACWTGRFSELITVRTERDVKNETPDRAAAGRGTLSGPGLRVHPRIRVPAFTVLRTNPTRLPAGTNQ